MMSPGTDALARLVEFELASYERLCGLKKKPTGEINRIESVLQPLFRDPEVAGTLAAVVSGPGAENIHTRLHGVIANCKPNGWSPFQALHKFFLDHRH